jgi:hypothetical protein
MNFRFRAFRAINELDTCLKFKYEEHNVLEDYGIKNAVSTSNAWMHNPDIYCVVAESGDDGRVVGGLRLHLSRAGVPLPLETAIGRMDEKVFYMVENYRTNGGVAEISALWNAKVVAGSGISNLLVQAGIACCIFLQLSTVISLCAEYTQKMFEEAGFTEIKYLENEIGYPYPNNTYRAKVLALTDPQELQRAKPDVRDRIKSISTNPVQSHAEEKKGRKINIEYNLVIID